MLPINYLRKTLDRCCGQWEFYNSPTQDTFRVKFLNTDEHYIAEYVEQRWHVSIWDSKTAFWSFDPFLSNRLNGHTRDDAGEVAPSDGWKDHDGKGFPPDNFYATHVRLRSGEVFPRNLNSASGACWIWRDGPTDIVAYRPAASTRPLYETPDKVVL